MSSRLVVVGGGAAGMSAARRVDRAMVTYRRGGRTHRLGFSALVVTAGGTPGVVPLPGFRGDRVFTIRTLEDAIALRSLRPPNAAEPAAVRAVDPLGVRRLELGPDELKRHVTPRRRPPGDG